MRQRRTIGTAAAVRLLTFPSSPSSPRQASVNIGALGLPHKPRFRRRISAWESGNLGAHSPSWGRQKRRLGAMTRVMGDFAELNADMLDRALQARRRALQGV